MSFVWGLKPEQLFTLYQLKPLYSPSLTQRFNLLNWTCKLTLNLPPHPLYCPHTAHRHQFSTRISPFLSLPNTCGCVCETEREREREAGTDQRLAYMTMCACVCETQTGTLLTYRRHSISHFSAPSPHSP